MLLQVKNLQISFSDKIVVSNISFVLERGKTLGIVGESGSGKTLTGLSFIGLLPVGASITSGDIYFDSPDVKEINLAQQKPQIFQLLRGRKISMIFQEPMTSLNPVLKCGSQLSEIIELHLGIKGKENYNKAIALLNEVKIPNPDDSWHKYPHQLSGGQRQRFMIAMALACNPELLIADEPTTALDVTVQKEILDLLVNIQKVRNLSILFISHDLGVIKQVSHHIMVMQQGYVVESGIASQILYHPKHPYTKGLIACKPKLSTEKAILPTVKDFLKDENYTIHSSNSLYKKFSYINSIPILEVTHLNTVFQTSSALSFIKSEPFKALKDINFTIFKGETVGLAGESGCGKTTLGRTIMQLIKQSSGDILYKGINISNLKKKELNIFRKNIQIIFQDPYSSLNPQHTIGEAIIEPMKVHGLHESSKIRKEKALQLLEEVGLDVSVFNRYPHQFSGGQRQRVVIARALVVQPELIICDESVSALDVSVQAQVLNLLNRLKKEHGLTFIFISHDLSVVKYMSDRVFVMQKGEIVEMEEANELYMNPKTEYTKKLIDAIPKF